MKSESREWKQIKNYKAPVLLIIAVCLFQVFAFAQNIDNELQRSLDAYKAGDYEEAKAIAEKSLERSPDYHDFRLVLARIYLKEQQNEKAIKELRKVLNVSSDYLDAYMLMVNAQLAAGNEEKAITWANEALSYYDNTDFIYKKGAAYEMMDDCETAKAGIEQLSEAHDDDKKLNYLKNRIQGSCIDHWAFLTYYYSFFDTDHDPWHTGELEVLHETKYLDILPRWSFAPSRDWSSFFQLDLYPKLGNEKTYGFFSAGYSPGEFVWPKFQGIGEVYQYLGAGFEGSLGFRYRLNKDPGDSLSRSERDIYLFSGSISKYLPRNLLLTYRHYYAPEQGDVNEDFHSQALSLSWYMEGHKYSYLRLTLFNGNYFDNLSSNRFNNISTHPEALEPKDFELGSKGVSLYLQKIIKDGFSVRGFVGYEREEYGFRPVNGGDPEKLERNKFNTGLGIGWMF